MSLETDRLAQIAKVLRKRVIITSAPGIRENDTPLVWKIGIESISVAISTDEDFERAVEAFEVNVKDYLEKKMYSGVIVESENRQALVALGMMKPVHE